MAITAAEYVLFLLLQERKALPIGGSLLEIGEACWYGDTDATCLLEEMSNAGNPVAQALREQYKADKPGEHGRAISRVFWEKFLAPKTTVAVDLDQEAVTALRLDLNDPQDLGRQFDIVVNLGTLEHVFDIANGFRTVHNHTKPGGLMVHQSPWQGWIEHGFYNLQPTVFWDLALANNYEVLEMLCTELKPPRVFRLHGREAVSELMTKETGLNHPLLTVAFRKPATEHPFQVPRLQGVYNDKVVTQDLADFWKKGR